MRDLFLRLLTLLVIAGAVLSLAVPNAQGQTWVWKSEMIDLSAANASLAIDRFGNLHVSYYFSVDGQLKYAFRPAGGNRWFNQSVDHGYGEFFTRITADSKGNPYICYSPGSLKFASFSNGRWITQQIDPGGGFVSYTCSVQVGPDDAPQVAWYVESGVFLRYARLKDGVWAAQTADQENKPGKWNSLVLNAAGQPRLAYVTIFKWELRYAEYDGNAWVRRIVDSPTLNPPSGAQRGMGNSLALDGKNRPIISYYDTESLKLARLEDGRWKTEVVERYPSTGEMAGWKSYRSSLVLDKEGYPHIAFVTPAGLEHAWNDGKQWRSQLIVAGSNPGGFDASMVIAADGTLYISYVDPADRTLKLATGRAVPSQEAAKGPATGIGKAQN